MSQPKVGREVAEAEFDRFAAAFDLEGPDGLDDLEKTVYGAHRDTVVRGIMSGKVVVDEAGLPSVFVEGKSAHVKLREPVARDFMGGFSAARDEVGKVCAVLASLSGVDAAQFSAMKWRDFQTAKSIVQLFM